MNQSSISSNPCRYNMAVDGFKAARQSTYREGAGQAMATLHSSTSSPGEMNLSDLLGSASQTQTDSFSEVLAGLTQRDCGKQAKSQAQQDIQEDED